MKIILNKTKPQNTKPHFHSSEVVEGLNRFLLVGSENYRVIKKPIRVVIKK